MTLKATVFCVFLLFGFKALSEMPAAISSQNSEIKEFDEVINFIKNFDELKTSDDSDYLFDIHNGDYGILVYDRENFSVENALADFSDHSDSCNMIAQEEEDLQVIIDMEPNSSGVEVLERLGKTKQIVAVISNRWDGEGDYSEYCSYNFFRIYFKDGTFLYISYDHTT